MGADLRVKGKRRAMSGSRSHSIESDDDEELSRQVHALGGDADDIALLKSKGGEAKVDEAQLSSELAAFMKKENMSSQNPANQQKKEATPSNKETQRAKVQNQKTSSREDALQQTLDASKGKESSSKIREDRSKVQQSEPSIGQRNQKDSNGRDRMQHQKRLEKVQNVPKAVSSTPQHSGKHTLFDGESSRVVEAKSLKLLIEPISEWFSLPLPPLNAPTKNIPKSVPDATVTALHSLGDQTLREDAETYTRLGNGEGGKNIMLGTLTQSDLQFARTLLTSNKAGTLSDRISAVTLLLQNSPLHNIKSLETLMAMAAKPSREEASRATRALADWFASGGGLGPSKLKYFRDQPLLPEAAAVFSNATTQALRVCVCVWAFEDLLKKSYFAFVQILERQTHDTLLFMRKQSVTQVFTLLRDKPEQEHNLLRLLSNKLGDPDRSVASKASTHLMELLHAHPLMKTIVLREVSEMVLRSQVKAHEKDASKGHGNQHATYYGVLTLNQTLFTSQDAELCNEVFSVYFQLFEVCLAKEEHEEKEEKEQKSRDKKRWRDTKVTADRNRVNKTASDVDSRLLAAILTGIRRVFPFTSLSSAALDKHLDTLFRITHTHSFNISIQALQLIFQVAIGNSRDDNGPQFSSQVIDRYFRTLYESLLDSRLATTSKQAMYLNVLYKSLKADLDQERVKAFVKRLCQILNLQDPPFICGSLVLLDQLFNAMPGLRSIINEPEEEGVEHFVDEPEGNAGVPKSSLAYRTSYDGRKRDPRFARAGETALWDLLPLQRHFHPSVSLNAKQLVNGEKVTSSVDMTLNTLMHFLDRFVFRNPKKVAAIKGSSIMQPALGGSMDSDVLLRRTQVPLDYVNSAAFWNQRPENVPADQQFFLQYFQLKRKREGLSNDNSARQQTQDIKSSTSSDEEEAEVSDELGTDDEDEKEIWKAMKSSMPQEQEEISDPEDDDDEVIKALENDEEDDGDQDQDDGDDQGLESEDESSVGDDSNADHEDPDSDDEPAMFLEDEDDLVPFTEFSEDESEGKVAGKKRPADEEESESSSKNRKRKEQRRKRRDAPAFASAEDYAHLLASDDEDNM
ncbi:RNA-binding ribosome biosynthesis protein mak21 [Malassezia psittaci]|uniref:RNA-binding ribosome biosynthesis protein mak21 n=1 Tax=Malassezia psittaci TaxID=1821823 RepID=A0AAF0JJ36_9BASI|nr:RNA-binding ribosome biosynthesis protein mak21 [Malassezia psittaci]